MFLQLGECLCGVLLLSETIRLYNYNVFYMENSYYWVGLDYA